MSKDGTLCRGKRAAWASTVEKSRHCKHRLESDMAPGLGLDACKAAKSGRDERGIGGGASPPGRAAGNGGGASVDLFIPKLNADLGGNFLAGAGSIEFCRGGKDGREGNAGGSAIPRA